VSWRGNKIDGIGVTPDVAVDWSYDDALKGVDNQMAQAVQIAQQLGIGSISA
jgi:C-terminal processing protease CtpA/Prc